MPIDACPILSPRLNALLAELRRETWTSALASARELELMADDQDEKVMLTLAGNWNAQEPATLAPKFLSELAGVLTIAFAQDAGVQVFGEPHLTYRVGEFAYRVSPTAFFQSSRFLLQELVSAVAAPGSRLAVSRAQRKSLHQLTRTSARWPWICSRVWACSRFPWRCGLSK